jgi:hypothetical protein
MTKYELQKYEFTNVIFNYFKPFLTKISYTNEELIHFETQNGKLNVT